MPIKCCDCPIEKCVVGSINHVCQITGEKTSEIRGAIRGNRCPLRELPEDDKIRVGDEVITSYGSRAVVLGIDSYTDSLFTVRSDGSCGTHGIQHFTKTGRHFDEAEIMLKKMRGEDDD